ncbi:hypothetical protein C8R45DRAFT_1193520 [Mycena sanguinolenta]|nr:hypothetical protein C8R45DRAFT_1193520 [Mycena sanguinolenta]
MSPPSTPPSIINTPPPPTARFTTPMHTVLRPSSFLLLSWPPRLFIYPQPAASTSVPPPTSRPEKQEQARQRSHDGDVTPRPWLGRASLRIHSHFTFATLFLPALPVICSRTHRRGLRRRKESPRGGVEATGCAIASRTRGSVHENVKGVVDVDTTVAHSCPSLKGDERKGQGNEERRKGSGKWKSEGKRERGRGSGKREVEGGRSSEQREEWRAGRRKDTYQGIPAHAHAHRSPNSTSTTHSPSTRSKACRQDGARRVRRDVDVGRGGEAKERRGASHLLLSSSSRGHIAQPHYRGHPPTARTRPRLVEGPCTGASRSSKLGCMVISDQSHHSSFTLAPFPSARSLGPLGPLPRVSGHWSGSFQALYPSTPLIVAQSSPMAGNCPLTPTLGSSENSINPDYLDSVLWTSIRYITALLSTVHFSSRRFGLRGAYPRSALALGPYLPRLGGGPNGYHPRHLDPLPPLYLVSVTVAAPRRICIVPAPSDLQQTCSFVLVRNVPSLTHTL